MAVEITSLQRAPDGRSWDPGAVRRLASTSSKLPPSPAGPRRDAESTADLPTLTLGVSRLPTSCTHCGSGLLNREPPLGEHARGMVTCETCGRQLAWLAPADHGGIIPRPTGTPTAPVRLPAPSTAAIGRPVVTARFNRADGCGPACSISFGHDPVTHEQFGRAAQMAEAESKPSGTLRSGPLLVDFDLNRVLVGDVDPNLSATEKKILQCLAASPMVLIPQASIIAQVWEGACDESHRHMLRVQMARLRKKLGPARRLIETFLDQGYRLNIEPPVEEEPVCGNDPSPRARLRRDRLSHRLAVRPRRPQERRVARAGPRRGGRRPFLIAWRERNGMSTSLKRVIPEGHVDAYCTFCMRDVVIPESTLACPHCGQNVNPLSLARVPAEHNGAAALARMAAEPTPPLVAALSQPAPKAESPVNAAETVERIELPPNLLEWYQGSRQVRDQLATEETELVEDLRRVRQARRLLDGLLARIAEPEAEPAPAPIVEVTPVLVAPEPQQVAISAPTTNGHAEMPAPRPAPRWARDHDRCINPNCGTTERKHAASGRCYRCHSYWLNHDGERPADLPARGGTPS